MQETTERPKKVETVVEARCAKCKTPLVVETFTDVYEDGSDEPITTYETTTGSCPCKE